MQQVGFQLTDIFSILDDEIESFVSKSLHTWYITPLQKLNLLFSLAVVLVIIWKGFKIVTGQDEPKSAILYMLKVILIVAIVQNVSFMENIYQAVVSIKKNISSFYNPNSNGSSSIFDFVFNMFSSAGGNLMVVDNGGWGVENVLIHFIGLIVILLGAYFSFHVWLVDFLATTSFHLLFAIFPIVLLSTLVPQTKEIINQWMKGIISSIILSLMITIMVALYYGLMNNILLSADSGLSSILVFGDVGTEAKGGHIPPTELSPFSTALVLAVFGILGSLMMAFVPVARQISEQLSTVSFDSMSLGRQKMQGAMNAGAMIGSQLGKPLAKAGSAAMNTRMGQAMASAGSTAMNSRAGKFASTVGKGAGKIAGSILSSARNNL